MGRFDDLTRLDEIKEKLTPPHSPPPSNLPTKSQKSQKTTLAPVATKSPSWQPHNQTTASSTTSNTELTTKRLFIKRTFDLFEDQLNYLTRESLQDRLIGKEGSMNSMVREAIDDWIRKRESKK